MNNVTILSFSPREAGNCTATAEFIRAHLIEQISANVQICRVDNKTFPACGECGYECLRPGASCPTITTDQRRILDSVCNSDLVYYIVPNFCGYPCANYFAFNERLVGYFGMDRVRRNQYWAVPKRFILISNSKTEQFTEAMRQQTNSEPQILFLATGKYRRNSLAGDLMTSVEAQAELISFLDG